MSEFLNVGLFNRNAAASRIERPEAADRPEVEEAASRHGRMRVSDKADFSEHALHLAVLRSMPSVRTEKVEAAKALIASGGYDDPEFLSVALDRMMDEEIG